MATEGRKPVLIMIFGRGYSGKTVLGNTIAQFYRSKGATLRIWDMAGFQTLSPSLARFHPDAETPPYVQPAEVQTWLEHKICEQMASVREDCPFNALLDVGNSSLIRKLGYKIPLIHLLEGTGIRPVALHVMGPSIADVDCLTQMTNDGVFNPEATLIVLNEGMITNGRSLESNFASIIEHPTIKIAVSRGAKVQLFPALAPMEQIAESRLMFADAAADMTPKWDLPLTYFDQVRVASWWEDAVPEFFRTIDPLWMPTVPDAAT